MILLKLLLALTLNAALLAWLLPWLRRQWREAPRPLRRVLLPGLVLRLLIGGLGGLHLRGDAAGMTKVAEGITKQLWTEPAVGLRTLLSNVFIHEGYYKDFHEMSNTYFFAKLLTGLNLASAETDWLNGLYLSLFTFVGCWILARTLARRWPQAPAGAAALAFLLWPSVLVSTSGVLKDTLVLGSGAWLLALVVGYLYKEEAPAVPAQRPASAPAASRPAWLRWLGGGAAVLLLAVLHFKMRYFFAVSLLAGLGGLVAIRGAQRLGLARRRLAQVGLLLGLLVAGAWLAPQISHVFRANKFTSQLLKIYAHNVGTSQGKPHFEYPDLRPTTESALRHAPLAVWNTLTRPWLGESRALPYVAAGLDNLALLALLGLAGWALWRGRAGHLPFALVLVLGLHCLLLAFLIGISTPNLGTMHRYRATMLPYLLLLLLQNDYAAGLLARLGLGNAPRPDQQPNQGAVPLPN